MSYSSSNIFLASEIGFYAIERRIRCAAHIFNLCVCAMLYGSKGENFAAINEVLCGEMLNDEVGLV